jgi:selenide, water dikinase
MKTDLLELVENGGCSSKIPPGQLDEIVKLLPVPDDPDILVGIDTHDDAGVYRINDDLAMVLTTDFFPPVCSDPYDFGQVAAANSISDIYAMGGDPVVALNIMMFPSSRLPMEAYAGIIKGGAEKAAEAGVKIIGGHTIDDFPPKYGLAVVGYVHPERIITNSGARPGDILILTKPIGTGIILAAKKLGLASDADVDKALRLMKLLNRSAAAVMKKFSIKGATDITGFGLAGHALKMARASNVTITLNMTQVPLIGNTLGIADMGCIPGAAFRNLDYVEPSSGIASNLDYNLKMIACDAQTSGGLLISSPAERVPGIISELKNAGLAEAAVVGSISEKGSTLLNLGE